MPILKWLVEMYLSWAIILVARERNFSYQLISRVTTTGFPAVKIERWDVRSPCRVLNSTEEWVSMSDNKNHVSWYLDHPARESNIHDWYWEITFPILANQDRRKYPIFGIFQIDNFTRNLTVGNVSLSKRWILLANSLF